MTSYAITGYSGGGKPMIREYEENKTNAAFATRPKNMNMNHKHLPEMQKHSLPQTKPVFTPIVGNYYRGVIVFIPLYKRLLTKNISQEELIDAYQAYFHNEAFINVIEKEDIIDIDADFISPTACNHTNKLNLYAFSNEAHFLIVAQFDNLGKGASGAAVQNLNIVLGKKEDTGL